MPAPSSRRKMRARSTEKVTVMQWFSLTAPQQPKNVTKKMMQPTTTSSTGALKNCASARGGGNSVTETFLAGLRVKSVTRMRLYYVVYP